MNEWIQHFDWPEIARASGETLAMLSASLAFTVLFGIPLGVFLFLTDRRQLLDRPWLHRALSFSVNVFRSVPFIILLIVMIPVTVRLVGTSLGVAGAIPPLVVGATPFLARLVETALRAVDPGIVEAALACGATRWQTVTRALLLEARAGIAAGITVTAIALVSYAAMSGVIGGGGLGDLAIRFGYQRFQTDVMVVTVGLLLVLVQLIQVIGDAIVRRYTRK